ncbi:hypothetical protein [Kitasatospora sp. GAS1066B]|uniref:hypothetical protein n=1 Tax=Kitasatospora sp. GAS1066B TaxID=3156271 RepID=UPI003511500C
MSPTCACAAALDVDVEPGAEAEAVARAEETGVVVTVPEEQPAATAPNAAAHSDAAITAGQWRTAIAS